MYVFPESYRHLDDKDCGRTDEERRLITTAHPKLSDQVS